MKQFALAELVGAASGRIVDTALPQPASGEVRVRVEAVGLGFVDDLIVSGRYQWKPQLPFVPGGEIVGTVEAVGEGVQGLTTGTRVAAWRMGGGLCEYCTLPAGYLVPVPAPLASADAAGMVLDYATADYALIGRGQLRKGDTVFVLGATGGVGGAAVRIARAVGAEVIAGVSKLSQGDKVLADGASAVVDCSAPDWRDQLRGHPLDLVFDPLGGAFTEPAFRSLGKLGRHLVVGFAAGGIPALPVNLPLLKSASLVGVDVRFFAESDPEGFRQRLALVFDQAARGSLRPPETLCFSLGEAAAAFAALTRRGRGGKVVVCPQLS